MAALVPTAFDGLALGYSGDYGAMFEADGDYTVDTTIRQQPRSGTYPVVTSHARNGIVRRMLVYRPHNSTVPAATFNATIKQKFDPARNSDGVRYLIGTGDDGSTVLRLPCYVRALTPRPGTIHAYDVILESTKPYFEANTPTTSAANPASVTNAGNTLALPSIALTTTTHATRRVATISGAGAGGGVIAYPVKFDLSDAAATSTNVFVFVEGVSVPCIVISGGTASSFAWALIDTASNGTTNTNVDIVYGSGLANPLCPTLDDGGMNLASSSNTSWVWNDWSVSTFPARAGTWRPARTGNHNSTASASYQITSEASGSVVISLGASGTYDNSADSILLAVGAKAGLTNAMTNLSRVTATLDGTNAQAYVRYRTAGSFVWTTAWSSRTNATVTTSIDLDNAVEVAVGIENDGATADPATLTISGSAALALTSTPSVSVAAAANMDLYNGAIGAGSDTITVNQFAVPDGTLTIDCEARTITSSVAGPFYALSSSEVLQFSDPDRWISLRPGANAISDTTGGSDVWTHRESFT